jgi:hypothetical protein
MFCAFFYCVLLSFSNLQTAKEEKGNIKINVLYSVFFGFQTTCEMKHNEMIKFSIQRTWVGSNPNISGKCKMVDTCEMKHNEMIKYSIQRTWVGSKPDISGKYKMGAT